MNMQMINKTIRNNGKKYFLEIFMILVLVFVWGAYILASFYGLPYKDDFSNGFSMKQLSDTTGYFVGALKLTVKTHMEWQGTYSGTFFTYFLSPFLRWGMVGCWLEYVINIVIFLGAIVFFLHQTLQYVLGKLNTRIFFGFLTIFSLSSMVFIEVAEVFYWHTGLCMYTLPFSLALITFSLVVSYFIKKKNWKIIMACMFAVGAAGGALMISAFLCAVLLGIFLFRYLLTKKIGKITSVFWVAFIGSLVNAIAPGNFVRKGVIEGEFTLLDSIISAIKAILVEIYLQYQDRTLLVVMFILLLVGIFIFKECRFEFKYPLLITVYAFFCMIITVFPVKFGYGTDAFPPRCTFIMETVITICLFGVIIYWSGWLTKRIDFEFKKEHLICIGLCIFILGLPLFQYDRFKEMKPTNIYINWVSGSLKEYYDQGRALFEAIENSEQEDVVINITLDNMGIYGSLDLFEDENYWVNSAVADFYGKNSVRVISK